MVRRLVTVAFVFGVIIAPRLAEASSITQLVTFSGPTGVIQGIAPFDPSLGTLNSVSVGITGTLSVTVFTPGFGGVTPVSYSYLVSVDQSFQGLAGQFFSFTNPASFLFTAVASGVDGQMPLSTGFNYGFQFTATTDLAGFVLPTASSTVTAFTPPLGGITGLRSNFLTPIAPVNLMQMIQVATAQPLNGPTPIVLNFSTTAVMQIDYNYTPVAAPVPEPASLSLLGLGLATLAIYRRRRR